MSSITTDQGIVHYEVYGRGRPVILLHGWLGSWGLWQETMAYLGAFYRTYALDFWGFGESGKKRETYAVSDFVSLVDQFMEQLGIIHAPLVGHSMGGTVSLSVAIKYPERVSKVVVVGSPIIGSSLAPLLKLAGYRPIASMAMMTPRVTVAVRFADRAAYNEAIGTEARTQQSEANETQARFVADFAANKAAATSAPAEAAAIGGESPALQAWAEANVMGKPTGAAGMESVESEAPTPSEVAAAKEERKKSKAERSEEERLC